MCGPCPGDANDLDSCLRGFDSPRVQALGTVGTIHESSIMNFFNFQIFWLFFKNVAQIEFLICNLYTEFFLNVSRSVYKYFLRASFIIPDRIYFLTIKNYGK